MTIKELVNLFDTFKEDKNVSESKVQQEISEHKDEMEVVIYADDTKPDLARKLEDMLAFAFIPGYVQVD